MAERKQFPVVNFRSVEYLLGQSQNQNQNLADILLHFPEPFGITHAPGLEQGILTYSMALWDGDDNVVHLGVNQNPHSKINPAEPRGLFYLQRDMRRILYDPAAEISLRDSYRGFYRNNFGTEANLSDLIGMVLAEGIPMHQITALFRVPGVKDLIDSHLKRRIHFGRSISQAYRMEGPIDLDAVMQQRLLPIDPLTSQQELEAILQNNA